MLRVLGRAARRSAHRRLTRAGAAGEAVCFSVESVATPGGAARSLPQISILNAII